MSNKNRYWDLNIAIDEANKSVQELVDTARKKVTECKANLAETWNKAIGEPEDPEKLELLRPYVLTLVNKSPWLDHVTGTVLKLEEVKAKLITDGVEQTEGPVHGWSQVTAIEEVLANANDVIGKATSPEDLKAAQATAKSRLKVINGIVSEVALAVTKLKKASEPPQARGKSK